MTAPPQSPADFKPELSFVRSDPERRFGLSPGRFTQGNQLVGLLMGIALTVGTYALLAQLPPSLVKDSLTERGPTPYAIVLFALWALSLLSVKFFKLRFQRRSVSLSLVPADPTFVLSPATVDQITDRLYELVDDPRQFVLFSRIQIALSNLRNMRRIGDVREVLDSQADHDEAMSESSYSIVRGLIWAIPVLGFIGTVLGLSQAIGSFTGVLANSSDIEQLRPALQEVTGGLATAFETTLQGLLAALTIHMLLTFIKRDEERFLDDCKEYCQRHIVGRLRLTGGEGD